jgi:hypothetical protein
MAITLDGTTGITTPGLTNTGTETIVNLTTTGNTILGDASTDTLNVGNGGLVKDASGNVGINTLVPARKLDIAATAYSANQIGGLRLNNTSAVAENYFDVLLGIDSVGNPYGSVQTGNQANSYMTFFTGSGPTERMRITSAGNVGIGTTVPTSLLYLSANSATAAGQYNSPSTLTLKNTSGSASVGGTIVFGADSNLTGAGYGASIYYSNGNSSASGTLGDLVFATKSAIATTTVTERMRIPSAGGVQAVTTISVGNATPSTSGAGITFPATQSASTDANTLEDYEEGTWTATMVWATQGSGSGNVTGVYTKIGNVVHLRAYPQAVKGSASGNFSITGIPFVASENTAVSLRCDAMGAVSTVVQATLVAASSKIEFTLINQSTAYGAIVTAAQMAATCYINIQCTYQI